MKYPNNYRLSQRRVKKIEKGMSEILYPKIMLFPYIYNIPSQAGEWMFNIPGLQEADKIAPFKRS